MRLPYLSPTKLDFAVITLALVVVNACSFDNTVRLKVDDKVQYQTIDGFGGFGAERVWWSDGPFYSDQFIETIIDELGLTILRDEIPLGFEAKNDNSDLNHFDYSTNPFAHRPPEAHTSVQAHLDYLRAMHDAGLEKLILSIWSPPLWMKENGERGNGKPRGQNSAPGYVDEIGDLKPNQLSKKYYQEFAEYCVAYIRLIKQETGLDVYAISLQNEPRFSQWYVSAVYSPEALAELIAVVGERFESEGVSTRIFGPEDVASYSAITAYMKAIFENETSQKALDIVAIHGYKNDGVTASDQGPKNWKKTHKLAQRNGKKLWMTETSGPNGKVYDEAFIYATSIYNALYYGQVNAWVFWQMSGDGRGEKALLIKGKPSWLFYVSKHFYRHIRPGFVRVKLLSNDKHVLALRFLSANKKSAVTLLINTSEHEKSVSINSLSGSHSCWVTTEVKQHEPIACMQDGVYPMPGKSITTISSEL